MVDHNVSTLRSVYISNNFYQYPLPWVKKKTAGADQTEHAGDFCSTLNTGWHIIPNFLWGHVCDPKQWHEMVMRFQSIKVTGINCRLFNPIPIQSAISFQGTAVFPAFNNTVYAMTYTDEEYETPWFDWWAKIYVDSDKYVDLYYEYNPAFKEGTIPKPKDRPFESADEAASSFADYERGAEWYPKDYFCKTYKAQQSNLQQFNTYRRIFLPIYWYHFTYKQYRNSYAVNANWEDMSTNHEFAYSDPSGMFWDPLNRPEEIGELRPGKNMVEYNWSVHPEDSNIWFNTDRIGFLTPYGRPRPLQPPNSIWNLVWQPRRTDPRGPGLPMNKYQYLKEMGLIKAMEPRTVGGVIMGPESHMGTPDWRRWPIVPSRWFYKEVQQQNPYSDANNLYRIYQKEDAQSVPMTDTGDTIKAGDVELTLPNYDFKNAGTEYEQHKYPPTQWFIKGVPLMDAEEKRIPVEMQMWMKITVNIQGKPRKSALYAPSWGPYEPSQLYSVNMDTVFGENYIRGRSGGARRTWYNPEDREPEMQPFPRPRIGELWQEDSETCNTRAYPADIGTIHTTGMSKEKGYMLTERHFAITHLLANKQCNNARVTFDTKTMCRNVTVRGAQ